MNRLRRHGLDQTLAILSVLISIVAVIASIFYSIAGNITPTQPAQVSDLTELETKLSDLETSFTTIETQLSSLEQRIEAIAQVPTNSAVNSEIVQIQNDIESLDTSLSNLEQVILDDPTKALQITLISKDMENLQQTYESDFQTTREEIGRVYEQNNWFIGLMFTMALGLLTLAVGNFLPKLKEKPKEDT